MKWTPGKFRSIKWIVGQKNFCNAEAHYDIACELKYLRHNRAYKYSFTSVHSFKVTAESYEFFCFIGAVKYLINPEDESLKKDLLLMLLSRTHFIFSDEFEKRKKGSLISAYIVPEYNAHEMEGFLVELINRFYKTAK